ncbi:MAG: CHAT domain-containing protein [Chloroflexi bacterium]|nr:CHAT domain-containing protein [Chloroflexota bacterium]
MPVWDMGVIRQLFDTVFSDIDTRPTDTSSEEKAARRKYKTFLRKILNERFDQGELRDLCTDLGVDHYNLPGEGTSEKARELIEYLERHNRLLDLVELGKEERTDISWPQPPWIAREISPEPSPGRALKEFCIAHFPSLGAQLVDGMSTEEMIQRLVEYCERTGQIETLLERIEAEHPQQYAIFAPHLRHKLPETQHPVPDKYFDLQIRVQRSDQDDQTYSVEAQLENGSLFDGGVFHLDQDRLRAAESDAQEYGTILFDALFSGPILRAYDRAIAYAETQTEGRLRIRLWIDNAAAELHGLAWERIHHRVQTVMVPIAASSEIPFSRYIGLMTPEPAPIVEKPVRLLFAVSNPADLSDHGLATLNVEKEIRNLINALGDLRKSKELEVTLMPGQTGLSDTLRSKLEQEGYQICPGTTSMDNIIRALSQNGGYHILHYLGHGRFDHRWRQAHLFLENDDGSVESIKDERIATLLKAAGSQLRLVFLAACESAKREQGDNNPFVGLAPQLIQMGIPAVVAMQDTVSVTAARKLTFDFYSHLLERGTVDRAMNHARLLLVESEGTDWATPVLFMRLKDGRLFG